MLSLELNDSFDCHWCHGCLPRLPPLTPFWHRHSAFDIEVGDSAKCPAFFLKRKLLTLATLHTLFSSALITKSLLDICESSVCSHRLNQNYIFLTATLEEALILERQYSKHRDSASFRAEEERKKLKRSHPVNTNENLKSTLIDMNSMVNEMESDVEKGNPIITSPVNYWTSITSFISKNSEERGWFCRKYDVWLSKQISWAVLWQNWKKRSNKYITRATYYNYYTVHKLTQ